MSAAIPTHFLTKKAAVVQAVCTPRLRAKTKGVRACSGDKNIETYPRLFTILYLYGAVGEAALREHLVSLHEQHDLVFLHQAFDHAPALTQRPRTRTHKKTQNAASGARTGSTW